MRVRRGDLVLLPYPFSNLSGIKVRPALVVSGDKFNFKSRDVIMVPLTSLIKDEPFSIIVEQKNLSSGKLVKRSRVKTDKIFCVDRRLIKIKIGKLDIKTFNIILEDVLRVFD